MEWFSCKKCPKRYNREDNLKIHVDEKHEGKLKRCGCGKEMGSSSFSRHKRKCQIFLKESESCEPKFESVPVISEVDSTPAIETEKNYHNDDIESITEHRVETTLKFVKLKNGSEVLKQNTIDIH